MSEVEKKLDVPKFTSFRPKAKPLSAEQGVTHYDGLREHRSKQTTTPASVHQVPRSHGQRSILRYVTTADGDDGHRHRERHPLHAKETTEQRIILPDNKPAQSLDGDLGQTSYCIDRNGDPHNLIYGTIHRYSIPSYRRRGAGNVLGLPKYLRISRNTDEQHLLISDHSTTPFSKRKKYSFARNERRGTKRLRIRKETAGALTGFSPDFIPFKLSPYSEKKRTQDNGFSSSDEELDRPYRSIEGKAKPKSPGSVDGSEYMSESSSSDYETLNLDSVAANTKARSIELSDVLERDSTNVSAWIALIDHQDAFHNFKDRSGIRRPTDAERRSTAEVKISMYEKALTRVDKRNHEFDRLLIGMMNEGSTIWESHRQVKRWQTILREHPNSIRLWTKYLDFQQTNFRTFNIEAARKVYLECIDVLKLALLESQSLQATHELQANQIYVILRYTLLMREAGFIENAIATWQGLLELNFFRPDSFNPEAALLDSGSLASLEEFWDSEIPRIGEVGAKGWSAYIKNRGRPPSPEQAIERSEAVVSDRDIFQSWVRLEKQRLLSSRSSARTLDELQEDDPYRVVFFSDVKDFLVYLPGNLPRSYLVNAFLAFCRLPPLDTTEHGVQTPSWWTDTFVRTDCLEQSDAYLNARLGREPHNPFSPDLLRVSDMVPDISDGPSHSIPFACGLHNFVVSPETLFAKPGRWFPWLISWSETYPADEGPVQTVWAQRVLRSLVNAGVAGPCLAERYLAFEWTNFPESARKIAKKLLKDNSSSLLLYNAYALIEWRSGNSAMANKVFSTALNMCSDSGKGTKDDGILLWKSWVWEVLGEGNLQRAWTTITSIPGGMPEDSPLECPSGSFVDLIKRSPTALLKTRKHLELGLEAAVSSSTPSRSVHYTDLLALLGYLSQDRAINEGLNVYRKVSDLLSNSPQKTRLTLELLHQAKARLLYYYATSSHFFRPAILREELAESIKLFPQNTIFLGLYAWNEARFRIDDRVRSIMSDTTIRAGEDTVVGWVFSIWNETKGTLGTGHNTNSIKAVFERAVDSSSGKSSPTIWKLYLLFSLKHLPHAHTASVFYRGVRHCPWVKELYMLAFKHLTYLGGEEFRRIYEVMREKELRIHVDLEEFSERMGGGAKDAHTAGDPINLPSDEGETEA